MRPFPFDPRYLPVPQVVPVESTPTVENVEDTFWKKFPNLSIEQLVEKGGPAKPNRSN